MELLKTYDTKMHPCVTLLGVAVCIKEGQVCGNGTAYPGLTCCNGLQCTGIHCHRPGGKKNLLHLYMPKYNFPHFTFLNYPH